MRGFYDLTRTDLAMEAFENTDGGALPGVGVSHWEADGVDGDGGGRDRQRGARQLGKPKGSYLTLECPLLLERDPDARLAMASLLAEEIDRVLPKGEDNAPVLVVGLGNRGITPDALGPAVVDRTLVTRHLLGGPLVGNPMKSVCAIAPGVLGVTGIESMELVEALVKAGRAPGDPLRGQPRRPGFPAHRRHHPADGHRHPARRGRGQPPKGADGAERGLRR